MAKDFNSSKVVNTYNEHIRKLIPGGFVAQTYL